MGRRRVVEAVEVVHRWRRSWVVVVEAVGVVLLLLVVLMLWVLLHRIALV